MKARTVIEVIASMLIVLFLYAVTFQVVSHPVLQSQINRGLSINILFLLRGWMLLLQLASSFSRIENYWFRN